MPVEQVGRLLRRWQDTGGVLSRARVIADGMRLISSLTPDERGVLARALAEEGAPELAARLESSSGGRIDASDLHRTAEGLLALDRDQIDHLAATLGDRDQRLRLAQEAASYGAAQLSEGAEPGPPPLPGGSARQPPPPAADTRLAPPPGAGGHPPRRYATESLHALANGAVPLDDPELGDQMLDHPGLGEVQLTEVGLTEVGLAEVGLTEVGLAEVGRTEVGLTETDHGSQPGDTDATGRPDATSGTSSGTSLAAPAGALAAAGAAATVRTAGHGDATTPEDATGTGDATRPGEVAAPGDATGPGDVAAPGDATGPGRRTEDEDRPTVGQGAEAAPDPATEPATLEPDDSGPVSGNEHTDGSRHADGRGHRGPPQTPAELVFLDHLGETPVDPAAGNELVDRLRQAGSAHQRFAIVHPDRVGAIGAAAALRVLDAVPEGWQRRRVAGRLGAAGALRGVRSSELLGRFPRDSDAAFVAGAALDDGSLTLEDLDGVVPDRLLRRLTTRARTDRRSEP